MYNKAIVDVESIFNSPTWKSNNISTYPNDYQGNVDNETEYCRVNILPSNGQKADYYGLKELSGLVAVKIFVKAGEGQRRLATISDLLDDVLQNKRLSNGTEFGTSYLNVEGLDPSNSSLSSATYFIPFKVYGE